MKFTREAWENAPEEARLEWTPHIDKWVPVDLIGFTKSDVPVVEEFEQVRVTHNDRLRIILPKRKVTVQLWRTNNLGSLWVGIYEVDPPVRPGWTLLGEHTFEVEGE